MQPTGKSAFDLRSSFSALSTRRFLVSAVGSRIMCSSYGDSVASSSASSASQPPKAAILERLTDAHAHPSDDKDLQRAKAALSHSKLKHVVRYALKAASKGATPH